MCTLSREDAKFMTAQHIYQKQLGNGNKGLLSIKIQFGHEQNNSDSDQMISLDHSVFPWFPL